MRLFSFGRKPPKKPAVRVEVIADNPCVPVEERTSHATAKTERPKASKKTIWYKAKMPDGTFRRKGYEEELSNPRAYIHTRNGKWEIKAIRNADDGQYFGHNSVDVERL